MSNTKMADICTLGKDCYKQRIDEIQNEIVPYILDIKDLHNGVIIEFPYSKSLQTKLKNLEYVETQCCKSLTWEITEGESNQYLKIEGVNPASIRETFSTSTANTIETKAVRLTKTGAVALASSAIVCCLLPVALLFLFGSAVATPFLVLQNPKWILVTAVIFAVPVWIYLGRRKQATRFDK